jgi:hypothetical protein
MSRKIAVDIGDADERFCNNCNWMNAEDDYEDHCGQHQGRIATKDWKPMRCTECVRAEIKPSISADKVRELIEAAKQAIEETPPQADRLMYFVKISDEILAELEGEGK